MPLPGYSDELTLAFSINDGTFKYSGKIELLHFEKHAIIYSVNNDRIRCYNSESKSLSWEYVPKSRIADVSVSSTVVGIVCSDSSVVLINKQSGVAIQTVEQLKLFDSNSYRVTVIDAVNIAVANCSSGGDSIRVVNIEKQSVVTEIAVPVRISRLACINASSVLIVDVRGNVSVWDVFRNRRPCTVNNNYPENASDGKRVAQAFADGKRFLVFTIADGWGSDVVCCYDCTVGKLAFQRQVQMALVKLAVDFGASVIYAGGEAKDGENRLYACDLQGHVVKLEGAIVNRDITSLKLSEDYNSIAVATTDANIYVFSINRVNDLSNN
jgi:hypothetical protein